jgi:hypothetical protein
MAWQREATPLQEAYSKTQSIIQNKSEKMEIEMFLHILNQVTVTDQVSGNSHRSNRKANSSQLATK